MDTNKYLVIDWEWIEDSLNDEEIEILYGLLEKASADKPERKYLVVDTQDPYAEKVENIIKTNRHTRGILKSEVLSILRELSGLQDVEVAHAEADEALVKYINDKDIEKAYDEVPKWFK